MKQYRYELLIVISFLVLVLAIGYKNMKLSSGAENIQETRESVLEFKELIILKKRWGNKKIFKQVDILKMVVPSSKVKWLKKSRKLTVSYSELNSKELNKVVTKILNLAVEILQMDIARDKTSYNMEFKCKW